MPAKRVCTTAGCPELVDKGKCDDCKDEAEARRGTAAQRGYTSRGHRVFRTAVLTRDPLCVCEDQDHGHGTPCLVASVVADHYPDSRRDLIEQGRNPNDPNAGRGMCKPCHDKHTSTAQPGGWNQR